MGLSLSISSLVAGVAFGILGFYFFRLGKRDANLPMLSLGLALLIFPYFVANPYACWGIGIVLSIMAFRSIER